MGNSVCELFHNEKVVCPPKMRGDVFTTAAVDNIDHNPSATTAQNSFHGTSIYLFQHPSSAGEGLDRSTCMSNVLSNDGSKSVRQLPHYYTDVPPVNSCFKTSLVSSSSVKSLSREDAKQHSHQVYLWLEHIRQTKSTTGTVENISWAAYHASQEPSGDKVICPTSLLPLFLESAHTVAMIKHYGCCQECY